MCQLPRSRPPQIEDVEDIEDVEQNKVVRRVTDITSTTAPTKPKPTEFSRASTLPAPTTTEASSTNSPIFQVCLESENEDLQVVCPEAYVCDQWAPRATSVVTCDSSVNKSIVFSCNRNFSCTNLGSDVSSGKELSVYDGKLKHKLNDIYCMLFQSLPLRAWLIKTWQPSSSDEFCNTCDWEREEVVYLSYRVSEFWNS